MLGLLRELRLGVLRWPGGNFVSNYHWADGIGPRDGRPRRPELAWGGEESNRFGTDEYLAYCAELGTEPYICLNMGTGTLADALAWVEYCNSAGNTAWAERRRSNGRGEPWRVTYWGLGNVMYGDWQVGAFTAEEYVREAGLEPSEDLVAEGDWTPQGGAVATRLLLERSPGLTAIFVHSDVMAIGVLSALWQAGRRVPADVAVVSCDDIPFAEFLTPPLSTVRIPLAETGRQAVELLLRSIAGEPVPERTPLLPVELIVRDSCGGRKIPTTKERH